MTVVEVKFVMNNGNDVPSCAVNVGSQVALWMEMNGDGAVSRGGDYLIIDYVVLRLESSTGTCIKKFYLEDDKALYKTHTCYFRTSGLTLEAGTYLVSGGAGYKSFVAGVPILLDGAVVNVPVGVC